MKQESVIKLATAQWCGPCQSVKAMLEARGFNIDIVDIDDKPEFAEKYGIRSIPTLIVLQDNEVTEKVTGDPDKILEVVRKNQ